MCLLYYELAKVLAETCPYLDVSMSCWWSDVGDVMCALDDRLVSLNISGKAHEFDEEALEDLEGCAYGCSRLRKISWGCMEPEGDGNREAIVTLLLSVGPSFTQAACLSSGGRGAEAGVAELVYFRLPDQPSKVLLPWMGGKCV